MRKDIPVCEFEIRPVDDGRVAVELIRIIDEKRMPLEMKLAPNIAHYLITRLAPTVYSDLGYCVMRNGKPLAADLDNIIDYTGGMSLIDDFWMQRKEDTTKKWADCNLFSNDISEEIADIAFSGEGSFEITEFVRSPEFTTDGMVDKAWRKIDGTIYLYKAGLSWKGPYATEQFSEFYAAQIARKLQLNYIGYDLDVWMGKLCSVCELFTSEGFSYVAAQKLSIDISAFIRSLDRNSKLYQELADIVLFDALALNMRHLGNFGFIQNNETFDIDRLAPIFDNGMALFGDVPTEDLTNPGYRSVYYILNNRKYTRAQPEVIKALLTERQRKLAKELTDFSFERHPEHNLKGKRLELLESIIRHRAAFLSET